jgi:hypothetical protein
VNYVLSLIPPSGRSGVAGDRWTLIVKRGDRADHVQLYGAHEAVAALDAASAELGFDPEWYVLDSGAYRAEMTG